MVSRKAGEAVPESSRARVLARGALRRKHARGYEMGHTRKASVPVATTMVSVPCDFEVVTEDLAPAPDQRDSEAFFRTSEKCRGGILETLLVPAARTTSILGSTLRTAKPRKEHWKHRELCAAACSRRTPPWSPSTNSECFGSSTARDCAWRSDPAASWHEAETFRAHRLPAGAGPPHRVRSPLRHLRAQSAF